jgi:hypothetical protein
VVQRSLQILAVASALLAAHVVSSLAETLQYNRDIRPIISDRCFRCHGPDKASRKAGLRLDLETEAFGPRKDPSEHAIVPGKPEQSLMVQRIFSNDPDERMPPPSSNLSLTDEEKNKLQSWIAQGAKYEPHWAFIPPPAVIPVPKVKNRKWPRNEIDHFILARLEKEGLKPSPSSDKTRWLRRVTYDLTGLPPAPKEIDAFLADKSAGAYDNVVDRLLASPHFGQRMAVPWLDAARYADSYGYQSDALSPTWPYRDWVVDAFNRNLPYNEFLTQQLAGDLLPKPTPDQRLATAFNRLHRQTGEGGSIEEEWRTEYAADRVQTFSSAVLGLTFECARCHDHKFDPVTQRDYYSLMSFFNSIDEYGLYNDSAHVPTPSLLLPTPAQGKIMQSTAATLAVKNKELAAARTAAELSFQKFSQHSNFMTEIPGLVGHFTGTNGNYSLGGNSLVPGKFGNAIRFTGDDAVAFTNVIGSVQPWDQYSVIFWINLPEGLTNAVVFHRSDGTDVGFHGTELSLEDGRLFFVIKRFWPGNAIAIRSSEPVPRGQWAQIGVSYDGSGTTEGMQLYVNGKPAPSEIVRNHLYKSPENGGSGFDFGARFRSLGLKGALLDEVRIYDRPLAPLQVAELFDGHGVATPEALRTVYCDTFDPGVARARAARAEALKAFFEARNPVQETSVMEELPHPRPTYVLARGRYDAPKTAAARVTRSTPAVLPPFPVDAPRNRLGLAQWLTAPNHPLTARVAVNHFWQMIFGRGIVSTPENFGVQGAAPTHPELLDWLARDFINSGWDTKALLKKMVLSATYRQDSVLRPDLREKDPENLLLARGPSQRLPSEMIRDTALAASGLLDDTEGGPPVSPYSPGDLWRESNDMSPAYHQSVGSALYRRSLYTVWKRTAPMPDMTAFDSPSREVCVLKRTPTATPQQAFVLLNDPQFVEAARVLAEKALKEGGSTAKNRIGFVFRRLTGRYPDSRENKLLTQLLTEQAEIFAKEPDRARQLVAVGDRKADPSLKIVDLAAMTELTQAVLNLDATIWKR